MTDAELLLFNAGRRLGHDTISAHLKGVGVDELCTISLSKAETAAWDRLGDGDATFWVQRGAVAAHTEMVQ